MSVYNGQASGSQQSHAGYSGFPSAPAISSQGQAPAHLGPSFSSYHPSSGPIAGPSTLQRKRSASPVKLSNGGGVGEDGRPGKIMRPAAPEGLFNLRVCYMLLRVFYVSLTIVGRRRSCTASECWKGIYWACDWRWYREE